MLRKLRFLMTDYKRLKTHAFSVRESRFTSTAGSVDGRVILLDAFGDIHAYASGDVGPLGARAKFGALFGASFQVS
jgi:hypothetical protein